MTQRLGFVIAAGAILAVAGCSQPAANQAASKPDATADSKPANNGDPVASALAAAPKVIAADAKVISIGADGAMSVLREGKNGFTCMPDNPKTPGQDPMCMDANAMKWAEAWMGHKTPPADNVGLMYMLAGGSDASNTDPYGTAPKDGKWVDTGPHVMVVGAESLNKLYPAGEKPDTTKPYVMFGGTPYAHMMIPIG